MGKETVVLRGNCPKQARGTSLVRFAVAGGDAMPFVALDQLIFGTVVYSPDGSLVALSAQDGNVRLHRRTGELHSILVGHRFNIWRLAFSPDGTALATASFDGTARIWPVRTSDLIEEGKKHLVRDFTPEERRQFAGLLEE